jgi:hypothetical protein
MILIYHFQFPEETENTQSPPANKNGNYTNELNKLIQVVMNKYRRINNCVSRFVPLKADWVFSLPSGK